MRHQSALVPKEFNPPENVSNDYFKLRKLTVRDAGLDHAAVMSSIDLIHKLRGGKWPSKDLTPEDDMIDLAWHQREFEMKRCFAYAVMDVGDAIMLGCVYLYPPGHPFNDAPGNNHDGSDVIVNMWVTTAAYKMGIYSKLWEFVEEWIRSEWPFLSPYFSNPVKP